MINMKWIVPLLIGVLTALQLGAKPKSVPGFYLVQADGELRIQLQSFPDSVVRISSRPFITGKHFRKIDHYIFEGDQDTSYEIHLQLTEIGAERFQLATQSHLLKPYVIMANEALISYRVVSSTEPQKLFFIKTASKKKWKQWIRILGNEMKQKEGS